MRTIEIKLYSYDELSDKAKQKVIEKLWDINVTFEWWDSIYEDAANIGLKLTGFDLDRDLNGEGHLTKSAKEVAELILNEHGESCETYATAKEFLKNRAKFFSEVSLDAYGDLKTTALEHELEDMEIQFKKNLLKDYANILQKEYEYLTERKQIIESIEANVYEFTEDGRLRNF